LIEDDEFFRHVMPGEHEVDRVVQQLRPVDRWNDQ